MLCVYRHTHVESATPVLHSTMIARRLCMAGPRTIAHPTNCGAADVRESGNALDLMLPGPHFQAAGRLEL